MKPVLLQVLTREHDQDKSEAWSIKERESGHPDAAAHQNTGTKSTECAVTMPSVDAAEDGFDTIELRPVNLGDYSLLYALSTAGQLEAVREGVPGPEDFPRALWADVFTQLIVEVRGEPLSLCAAKCASIPHGFVYVSEMPLVRGGFDVRALGFRAFLRILFTTWDFRKVYCTIAESQLGDFTRISGGTFNEEGFLSAHSMNSGQACGEFIFGLSREAFLDA